jgi:hypothetical protein
MGFLRALLIILLIFLLIRLLVRLLFAWGVRRSGMGDSRSRNTSARREGDVTIKYKPGKDGKIIEKDDGEYIKFEDVDED